MSSDEYDSEEEEEAWVETATCQLRSPVPETSLIGEAGGWLQSSLDWMLLSGPAHGAADAAGGLGVHAPPRRPRGLVRAACADAGLGAPDHVPCDDGDRQLGPRCDPPAGRLRVACRLPVA